MNVDQKIALRNLLSDVLLYMADPARNKSEILVMQDKLELAIEKLIDGDLQQLYKTIPYKMPEKTRLHWRLKMSAVLLLISQPDCTPGKVLAQIHDIESMVEGMLESAGKEAIGKPKMFITKGNGYA
jgi:hypothetical protein